jgi:hypothetical protein
MCDGRSFREKAKLPTIGRLVYTAMDSSEMENTVIRGVLPKSYGRFGLRPERLESSLVSDEAGGSHAGFRAAGPTPAARRLGRQG